MQLHKQPPPRAAEAQNRRDVKQLTNTSKNLYSQFDMFHLEASRLSKLDTFIELMNEVRIFNDELDNWKKKDQPIKNLRLTYSLYENLFSRLKYISNFSKSQIDSEAAVKKTLQWFFQQKPKLRCQVKQTTAIIKNTMFDPTESSSVDKMLQTNLVKREMQPYELMSRTAHPGMFPPKEALKEYKRKQFLPYTATQPEESSSKIKKSNSASAISKNRLSKFRMSIGTLVTSATSLNQTKQNFKKTTVSQFKIDSVIEQKKQETKQQANEGKKQQQNKDPEDVKTQEQKLNEQKLDEIERENKVQKEQIMQQNLVQNLGEEDAPDEEDQDIYQDEEIKQPKKKYTRDHDPQQIQYAIQLAKQQHQSSLRRVMKINEQKIRSKLQDLDIRRNMLIWGKIKGQNNRDQSRRLQGLLHTNNYHQVAYKKKLGTVSFEELKPTTKVMSSTTGFSNFKQVKEPQVLNLFYRSKSSTPIPLEQDIQKLKIKQVYRAYGRHINHLPQANIQPETPQEDGQDKKLNRSASKAEIQRRSMSLTCLSSISKKKHFSNILGQNKPSVYNEIVQDQVIRIKTSLSKKGTALQNGVVYKALSAVIPEQTQEGIGLYTAGRDLLSNPFFPKNLGKKKKKKKK